jgi:Predicted proline hydroxylase
MRRDQILWLEEDGSDSIEAAALAHLDRLRLCLNQSLLLGLQEGEFHYAHYAPGSFYRLHRDRFADCDARVVSLIAYLNAEWQEADGGALRLFAEDGRLLAKVMPRAGTMVVFLSAEFPHEVEACRRDRFSLTGWFRQRKRLF